MACGSGASGRGGRPLEGRARRLVPRLARSPWGTGRAASRERSVGVGVAVTGCGAPRLRGQAQRWAGGAGRKGDRAAAEAPAGESCPFPRGPATGPPGFCHQGPRPKGTDSEPKRNHQFQANTLLRGHTYRVCERPLPSGAHAAGSPRSRGARLTGCTASPGLAHLTGQRGQQQPRFPRPAPTTAEPCLPERETPQSGRGWSLR